MNVIAHLDKVKCIGLQENIKTVGKVLHARLTDSLSFYILDSQGGRIILYDTSGAQRKVISRYGDGPSELKDVLSLALHGEKIFIPEYYRGIKVFTAEGTASKHILIQDKNFVLVSGDIEAVGDNILFLTCVWDGKVKDSKLAAVFIDTAGDVKEKVVGYPREYSQFLLTGRKCGAIRGDCTFAVCFAQSPALIIGSLKEKNQKLIDCVDRQKLYISPKRRADSGGNEQEMWKLLKEEWLNYRIVFLNDTLIARARCRETDESIRLKSLVLRQNSLDIFTLTGHFLGEVQLPGRLHDACQDLLFIEESDAPENRQFGFYKITFQLQLANAQ